MARVAFPRLILALLTSVLSCASVSAETLLPPPPCIVAPEQASIRTPLARVTQRLALRQPLKIVALGSSSTYGHGASTPAHSYPSRLAADLAERLPGRQITVLNRGVKSDEAPQTLARLDTDVIAEKPDLVLWQVGTNAVVNNTPLPPHALHEGIARMHSAGADVVMVDPQFAPRVVSTPQAERMASLIANAAASDDAGVFRRFALMRYWHEVEQLPLDTFLTADQFHMNDWGYACFAKAMGAAIASAGTMNVSILQATRR